MEQTQFLQLNVKKLEMRIDFRTKKKNVPDLITDEKEIVERVSQHKYLGFWIDEELQGSFNTEMASKKCN